MIQRPEYLKKLIDFREKQIIKVVTGVRRCGKSTLFELYKEYLFEQGVLAEQIVSVNLEDMAYENLLDYKMLYQYIKERMNPGKMTYVFIDEAQNCQSFEKVVDSLFIQDNVDVYITGSNAYMLSGELATLLAGRYVTIDMLPLSFQEYYEANQESNASVEDLFNDYIQFGSFPYLVQFQKNMELINPYLEGIYSTILIKDVAAREGITDVTVLENIIKTLASSIGSPISIKKITDTIQSSGRKISANTVDAYVRALTDSYIFYKANRYDIKGRQYLKTLGKYYIVDTGIRQMLMSQSAMDTGHLIENIVYLELKRRGFKVNIGKVDQAEVDFVATSAIGIKYYQVSLSVLDEKTLKRELAPLEKIDDYHPKFLLTLDRIGSGTNHKGIQHINLLDWLLEK